MKKLFHLFNMNNIIFYSNYCENSKKILTELTKTKLKEELYYICIDKRRKDQNGAVYIILENGQEIIMPPSVTAVPCLLLIKMVIKQLWEVILLHIFSQNKTN